MPLQPSDLDTALDVKRGFKRLQDLPNDERSRVSSVLRHTTGAQFADMAKAKERPRHAAFRHSQNRR
jgi:hypothetical protein